MAEGRIPLEREEIVILNFSLRRCKPNQVQRDSLNSLQNTPKANSNLRIMS